MIEFGSLETKINSTNLVGSLRIARGIDSVMSTVDQRVFVENFVTRVDTMIKRLVENDIGVVLDYPSEIEPISLMASETACIVSWPTWFTEATPSVRLELLLDWRRALLNFADKIERKTPSRPVLSAEHIASKRKADRERKQRSRAAIRARLGIQSKSRGRPRKTAQ